MDEHTQPSPEIMPQATEPVNYGSVKEAPKPVVPKKIPPLLVIGGVLLVLIIGSVLFAVQNGSTITPEETPVSSPMTPTPTSTRTINAFATQSAFIKFEEAVTQLPSILQGAAISDPTLGPPVLELKLGFSN